MTYESFVVNVWLGFFSLSPVLTGVEILWDVRTLQKKLIYKQKGGWGCRGLIYKLDFGNFNPLFKVELKKKKKKMNPGFRWLTWIVFSFAGVDLVEVGPLFSNDAVWLTKREKFSELSHICHSVRFSSKFKSFLQSLSKSTHRVYKMN